MRILILLLSGYLIGSIPFALVVGKLFYQTDVRCHGSGNLGGGNTGRVLGKKAGLAVMTLDLLKVTLVVRLACLLDGSNMAIAGGALAAAVGHCWPVFARFRGGKAVATLYGFLFGLICFCGISPLAFFLPLAVFLLILRGTRIIALASIGSAAAAGAYLLCTAAPLPFAATACLLALLILLRHRGNLTRIRRGEENRISWM